MSMEDGALPVGVMDFEDQQLIRQAQLQANREEKERLANQYGPVSARRAEVVPILGGKSVLSAKEYQHEIIDRLDFDDPADFDVPVDLDAEVA